MSACPHCGYLTVDAGMSGTFCNTPGCPGNYWSGNAQLERENAEALQRVAHQMRENAQAPHRTAESTSGADEALCRLAKGA
jgi:hypothetical protein